MLNPVLDNPSGPGSAGKIELSNPLHSGKAMCGCVGYRGSVLLVNACRRRTGLSVRQYRSSFLRAIKDLMPDDVAACLSGTDIFDFVDDLHACCREANNSSIFALAESFQRKSARASCRRGGNEP